jgi:hypothetical protein
MDRRKPPISLRPPCKRTDADDAAPIDSVGEDSSVIYFGNAQRISEGFAIALRMMGFEADILPSNIAQSDTISNPGES